MPAWETLFDRHYDRIYRYALGRVRSREAAEDIAAATFDRALATDRELLLPRAASPRLALWHRQ